MNTLLAIAVIIFSVIAVSAQVPGQTSSQGASAPAQCTYIVLGGVDSFSASGGPSSIFPILISQMGCPYVISVSDLWITSNPRGSGIYNDIEGIYLQISVSRNESLTERSGSISFGDKVIEVSQFRHFLFLTSNDSAAFTADGGTGNIGLQTDSGFGTVVKSSATWLSVAGPFEHQYNVAPNYFHRTRQATLTWSDITPATATLTVTQAANPLVFGDLNLDGVVDAADLVMLANYLAGNIATIGPTADVFKDNAINATDLVTLANFLAGNISELPVVIGQ